jgi:hypothetical protein
MPAALVNQRALSANNANELSKAETDQLAEKTKDFPMLHKKEKVRRQVERLTNQTAKKSTNNLQGHRVRQASVSSKYKNDFLEPFIKIIEDVENPSTKLLDEKPRYRRHSNSNTNLQQQIEVFPQFIRKTAPVPNAEMSTESYSSDLGQKSILNSNATQQCHF